MTTEPPRRLRPSGAARVKTILTQTRGAQSAQGSTGSARPVADRPRSKDYTPPAVGALVASASYRDPASSFAYGFGDPSQKFKSFGDDGLYFAYDSGSQSIQLLLPGWYQFAVDGFINGGTA